MSEKILIVEDEFVVANELKIILENSDYTVCDMVDTVEAALSAVNKHQPTWVLLDIFLHNGDRGTELAPYLQQKGIGFIYISANTNQSVLEAAKATKPYGFIVKPFREKDLLIMLDIARTRHESSMQLAAERERLLQQHIRALSDLPVHQAAQLKNVAEVFQSLVPFDLLWYRFVSKQGKVLKSEAYYRTGFVEYEVIGSGDLDKFKDSLMLNPALASDAKAAMIELYVGKAFRRLLTEGAANERFAGHFRLESALQYQRAMPEGTLQLSFYSKEQNGYEQSHVSLLQKVDKTVFTLFCNIAYAGGAAHPVTPASRALPAVVRRLESPKFEGIIGNSASLLHALDHLEMAAPTDVSVLILGESGTGKEKVALNIHRLSPRSKSPFTTVNCAAMPASLIESELFGHEKGAFTGAVDRRIGKFELAAGGTIFLDEIGELPLESQVKLLRVLQEREFERIGSGKTMKTDVRIITATNRNLEKEVSEGRFRLDLFYRLNVFPISLPPLRERKEDIPILARHFLLSSARKLDRAEVPVLSARAMEQLCSYLWPGNIRELEHLIERSVIKAKRPVIDSVEIPHTLVVANESSKDSSAILTLEQMETEHIISVLNSCNGRVFGAGGAAEILGLPPSTLTSRMKKLGIKKGEYHLRDKG